VAFSAVASGAYECCTSAVVRATDAGGCPLGPLLSDDPEAPGLLDATCLRPRATMLELAMTANPADCPDPGSATTYALSVTNPGVVPATGYAIDVELAMGHDILDAQPPLQVGSGRVLLDADSGDVLAPGETRTYTFRAMVPCLEAGVVGVVSSRATLTVADGRSVSRSENVVWSAPDLSGTRLVLDAFDDNANGINEPWERTSWRVVVRNGWACPARDVAVVVDLGWPFDPTSVGFEPLRSGRVEGTTVTWTSAELPALAWLGTTTVTVPFSVRVDPRVPAPQVIPLSATVAATGHEFGACDPAPQASWTVPGDRGVPWGDEAAGGRVDLLRNAQWPASALASVFGAGAPNRTTCGRTSLDALRDVLVFGVAHLLDEGVAVVGDAEWGSGRLVFYELTEQCVPAEGGTDLPICVTRSGSDVLVRAAATGLGCEP
jgi:hypothetical protein